MRTKLCCECGASFVAAPAQTTVCSPVCRSERDRRKAREYAARDKAAPRPEPTGEKVCTVCGVTKPRTEFLRNPQGRDGFRSHCKPCHVERNRPRRRAHYHRNRERVLGQMYAYRCANVDKLRRWQLADSIRRRDYKRAYCRRYYLLNHERLLEDARRRKARRALSFDHGWDEGKARDRAEYNLFQAAAAKAREHIAARERLSDLSDALPEPERELLARLMEDGLENLSDEDRGTFARIQELAQQIPLQF